MYDTFRVEPLMNALEEAGLVSPADGLRALGALGDDRRVMREAHVRMLTRLPKDTAVNVAPLTGAALEQALDTLVSDYLPSAYQKLKAAGVLQSQTFRDVVVPMAQDRHLYAASLPALERAAKEHQATQAATHERAAVARVAPSVQAMSEGEFDASIGRLYTSAGRA